MKLRKEAASRPDPEAEEAPLQNEAISEGYTEKLVTSNDPNPPVLEAVPTEAAPPVDRVVTPAGPVLAPD